MMKYLAWAAFILLPLLLFFRATVTPSVAETFCPPGQQPHFSYGFAFLKSQLGNLMGDPLECEHYDAAGNAAQKTTTGQAFYDKATNTPTFTSGNQTWAWTSAGLQSRSESAGVPPISPTPLAAPRLVRVMSYNILFGAGADPAWAQRAADLRPFDYPGNRLPQILGVIKAAEPDILGLQEAADWDDGSPPIAQQVADELGMNYFLAPVGNGLHLAVFSKFDIVETENLSQSMGNVGALRATLAMPDGRRLHVFVVHLDPFSATTRAGELGILTQEMAPYLKSSTLLIGDMNFYCLDDPEHCQEYQVLNQAGWRLALAGKYKIDQIWASPPVNQPVEPLTFPGATFDISDHLPVGAVINVELTEP